MSALEFWFDFSCPYAYLASTQVEALAARTGAEVDARPMLLGGVFEARQVPQKLFATLPEAKARHNANDLRRWAARWNVPYAMPSGHPFRTVTALRVLLAQGAPYLPLAHHFFRAYWVDGQDIGREEVVRAVLSKAGLDVERLMEAAQTQAIKDELRARTDEAIARGIFGAPSIFVGDELFWGQDRLDFVEQALGGTPEPLVEGASGVTVDLYFDFMCPYSAIAVERIERLLGHDLRWRPIELEAVFRSLYGHDHPPEVSPAKRAYLEQDLQRQASAAGVKLLSPGGTASSTQLSLRLAHEVLRRDRARAPELIRALFRARWRDGLDTADSRVIREVADAAGFDGAALLDDTGDAETTHLLEAETKSAIASGVYGTPSVVIGDGSNSALFFGNDRLELATLAARGDIRLW